MYICVFLKFVCSMTECTVDTRSSGHLYSQDKYPDKWVTFSIYNQNWSQISEGYKTVKFNLDWYMAASQVLEVLHPYMDKRMQIRIRNWCPHHLMVNIDTHLYFNSHLMGNKLGSLVVRALAPCLGGPGLIPGRVKPKISNW